MKPSSIAIVGMAGRFPGARNIRQFWRNLRDGVESIRSLTDSELLAAGAKAEDLKKPDYIKRTSTLDDISMFDAAFFGLSPRDAAIMDPQHRHFLECAWESLEDAGHPPASFGGSIGVFAGSGMNSYLIHNLLANHELAETAGLFQLKQTGNDKDLLATRVSYQLDLRGPSINVQTACSTSLVAVHLACQSLLDFECDMALAGGVTIEIPHGRGYLYRDGEILSRDGHCRAFDAASTGTVFGSGAGIVVLRRIEDAIADRDSIRAVILGSAVNNDGARKVGYFAPSVEGQAEVIAEALEFAGVNADDISYVEAHGTGTRVGDPIEVRALTQAFRRSTSRVGYCGIGSVKTNIGHLDTAAGITGLIKTVLALEHAQLPPSLHFHAANPHIDFHGSPFFVNAKLRDWLSNQAPRRAGVTSLGIGGTNAHVVLQEAPALVESRQARPCELFVVSAKSESALERGFENLAAHLVAQPDISLADASFTCQSGRQAFPFRRAWVVDSDSKATSGNSKHQHAEFVSGIAITPAPAIAFMFPGQGSQHVNMGRELYEHEVVFRDAMDLCAGYLREPLGLDLRDIVYPKQGEEDAARERLNQTWLTQPALFSIEYSLARWWMSLGIEPGAMVGHSIGEYVAACIAGVFSLQQGLAIAAFRGRLMNELPPGAMLAVLLPETSIRLNHNLSLAAVNSPGQCVVSGPESEIAALEQTLLSESISCRRLVTSHGFHSAQMDPILGAFEERLRSMTLQPPRIPYLSNLTGTWIKPHEATDPGYWSRHLRQTVRYSDCLTELSRNPDQVLVEVGPGNILTSLARQHGQAEAKAFQSLPRPEQSTGDLRFALHTAGRLWTIGAKVDFAKLHSADAARRIPLPTYPFERASFWIYPDNAQTGAAPTSMEGPHAHGSGNVAFYRRIWMPAPLAPKALSKPGCWMIFRDSLGLGDRIGQILNDEGQHVILVDAGSAYSKAADRTYTVNPGERGDYDALLADILKDGPAPDRVLHLWSVMEEGRRLALRDVQSRSFLSPLFLVQAWASRDLAGLDIALVSNQMQQVSAEPVRNPARAVLLGPAKVIPKELPGITCSSIDLDFAKGPAHEFAALLIAEMNSDRDNATIAYREGRRFTETIEPHTLPDAGEDSRLERGGVYLITGGLGGLGLAVAEQLAREFKVFLVLVSRSALPPESDWGAALLDASMSPVERSRIQKLMEIRSSAAGLAIAHCDVTNLGQVQDVVAMAISKYGKIDGVFHAAGVLDDGPLMLKTAQDAERVLDPKVRGTLVLEQALRNVPLRCFVLFSSISSIDPPPGQVDYAAANAFLDAFAASRKGSVTVVNWGAWKDVGMAARSASSHPLLRERLLETPHEIVYAGRLSTQAHWPLAEHRLKVGESLEALLPGTAYLEMALAALPRGMRNEAVEFTDVFFLAPLMLPNGKTGDVRIQLKREQESDSIAGSFRFSVFSHSGDWVEHCTGTIGPCIAHPTAKPVLADVVARCHEREIVFDELHRTRQERHLAFGPRWHSLRRLFIGNCEALAEIEIDANAIGDVSTFRIHPALFDLATGVAVYLSADYENCTDLFLPVSYKRIRLYRSIPGKVFSHIRARRPASNRNEVEVFDITLFDQNSRLLAEVEGYSVRRIADATKAFQGDALVRDEEHARREAPIEIPAERGILPVDGVRALIRILSTKSPRAVVAVSQPLAGLDQSSRVPPVPKSGAAISAVDASNDTIEGTLAAWWREALGVEQVKLDDDFFNLGGHSLIGVRLIARIRKAYRVDLDFGVLFEARTIRQLAGAILKAQSASGGNQLS